MRGVLLQAAEAHLHQAGQVAGSGGPAFLFTHPRGPDRIKQQQANVPKVMPLYRQALRGKS